MRYFIYKSTASILICIKITSVINFSSFITEEMHHVDVFAIFLRSLTTKTPCGRRGTPSSPSGTTSTPFAVWRSTPSSRSWSRRLKTTRWRCGTCRKPLRPRSQSASLILLVFISCTALQSCGALAVCAWLWSVSMNASWHSCVGCFRCAALDVEPIYTFRAHRYVTSYLTIVFSHWDLEVKTSRELQHRPVNFPFV